MFFLAYPFRMLHHQLCILKSLVAAVQPKFFKFIICNLACQSPSSLTILAPLRFISIYLGPVVQRLANAIHQINHYPADSVVCFVNTYLLDSDLSGGQRYPAFKQLGPVYQYLLVWCFLPYQMLFSCMWLKSK